MKIEISIITVNYNGLDDTCALIDTIPSDESIEVIVVDNGSKTDEAALIAQRYPHVKAIRSDQNLGFAGGNNIGLRQAKGQYLYLINNDTVLFKENSTHGNGESHDATTLRMLQALKARLKASPTIGMVCPKIRFAWDDSPIQFAGYTPLSRITLRNRSIGYNEADHGQYDTPHPTPYAHGAAMMLKREALEKAGLMPECYFLYYEELDWSLMVRRSGYEIWYEPAATIYHKESQSTGQDSPLKIYYITRNRLLFAKRNLTGITRLLTYCYLTAVVGLRDIVKYAVHGNTALLKATLRGVRDFMTHKQTT